MRSLAIYLKNYKKESIFAPFFKFLEVVFDLLVPVVIAQIIDVGITGNDRHYIIERFFILVLMAAAGLTVSITAQFFAAKASVGFATELRQAVYDHVQKLSYTELDTLGTDTLITRLTDDINQVQNGVNMGLRLLLRSRLSYSAPWSWHSPSTSAVPGLRRCDPIPVSGRFCDHVSQYPAFPQGTEPSGYRHKTDQRKPHRCTRHPCILPRKRIRTGI